MIAIVSINLFLLVALVSLYLDVVPGTLYKGFVRGLHGSMGIRIPTGPQFRLAAIIWTAYVLVVFDGMLMLMRYVL